MIAKMNETRQFSVETGTYNGVSLSLNAAHVDVNERLSPADISPDAIQIKVLLKRRNQTHMIMQDNLLLLGIANAHSRGLHEFFLGVDVAHPSANSKHQIVRFVNLDFGGHIRVGAGDTLLVEVAVAKAGVVSGNVDAASFHVEFDFINSIGYETGIPETKCEVVQTNITKQTFALGDNVTSILFVNLDKNDHVQQVISNVQLASDRLDLSLNYNQLLARDLLTQGKKRFERFGSALPITDSSTGRVFRGADFVPQTLCLLDAHDPTQEVDNCRLDIAFNGAQVAASSNYVISRRYYATQAQLLDAEKRSEKHLAENIAKLPAN